VARYRNLGLEGRFCPPTTSRRAQLPLVSQVLVIGMACPRCYVLTFHKSDGCIFCASCGYLGDCNLANAQGLAKKERVKAAGGVDALNLFLFF
jgi:hypothetical protein